MSANAKAPPAQLARFVERVRHHLYRLHQRLVPAPVALSELVVGAWVAQADATRLLGVETRMANSQIRST
jgi:C-methyltransferase